MKIGKNGKCNLEKLKLYLGVSILLMAAVMMPVSAQNETAVTTQATAEAATLPDAAPVDGGATEDDATPTGETPSEDPPADDTTEGAVENLPEENGDETPTGKCISFVLVYRVLKKIPVKYYTGHFFFEYPDLLRQISPAGYYKNGQTFFFIGKPGSC